MPATPLGHFRRCAATRFIYGAPKNYRLKSCLTALPNSALDQCSLTNNTGAAPLTVDCDTANPAAAAVPVGRGAWPAPAAGYMSTILDRGGIAVQGPCYPRVDGGSAITSISSGVTWTFGDATADADVAFNTTTQNIYAAGTYTVTAVGLDGLGRTDGVQTVGTVTAT